MFEPLTIGKNGILWAHLTWGWYKQAAVDPGLSERWQGTAGLLDDLLQARKASTQGRSGSGCRAVTGPAERSQQARLSEMTSTERAVLHTSFRPAVAADTWTADAAYTADSPVPYTLTAKAETLPGEVGSPTPPLRNAHACGMETQPPQARPSLPGQPRTYVTEISMRPSDGGIHQLHARMKEPEPEPEAGL
jgi:hypothetical protein